MSVKYMKVFVAIYHTYEKIMQTMFDACAGKDKSININLKISFEYIKSFFSNNFIFIVIFLLFLLRYI